MERKADVLRKAEGRAWPGRTCKRDEFAELDADGLLRGAGCGMHGLSGSHAGALLLPAEPDEPGLRGGARARLAEGAGTADRGAVMRRSDMRHYLSGLGVCLEVIRKNPADSWRGSRSCLRKSRAYLTRYVPSLDTPALSGSHAKIRTKLRRSSEQIIFCRSMTFIWSHFYSRFFFMRNDRRGGEQSGESSREIDGQPCRAPRGVSCTAVFPSCG